jgi:hypothetical protein
MPAPTKSLGLGFALLLALGACAEMQQAVPGVAQTGGTCPADAHQDWVGQSLSSVSGDMPEGARLLLPGAMATMDYREDRMNVEVDASDTVTRVYCG